MAANGYALPTRERSYTLPHARDETLSPSSTAWADGLRGVAAVFVVVSHLVLCLNRGLMYPCCGPDETTPRLFQRPIFRLVAQGQAWVSIFFILTGFVNALKPLRLARAGNVDTALSDLASSTFRRAARLVLPATFATVVSWLLANMGVYWVAANSEAYWIRVNSPGPSSSWGTAIEDLFLALRSTWSLNGGNRYDQPQWTLIYFLQGSIMVIMALIATVHLASRWRLLLLLFLYVWSLDWTLNYGDPYVGFDVLAGVMLAETFLSSLPMRFLRWSPLIVPPLALVALVFMSMPLQSDGPDRAGWSRALFWLCLTKIPRQYDIGRFYSSIGSQVLVLTIILSPHLRRALSHPLLLWLGKISFPLYLVHGMLMRTVFAWLMFLESTPVRFEEQYGQEVWVFHRYPLPGPTRTTIAIVVLFVCVLGLAHLWTVHAEPIFGRMTKAAESKITRDHVDLISKASPRVRQD